ncbi:hypothetical protein Y032_0424g1220 [Ancylostoma ceylanicum]|uniref:Regulatory protein zeste n=1 Tax=Ancylostoma ceylanicum TaxID=53326 RepID=A0A016X236_9BILA|nr:hypothetical protein Y032_0424g1220 [Ancylostoma ceylanicum]
MDEGELGTGTPPRIEDTSCNQGSRLSRAIEDIIPKQSLQRILFFQNHYVASDARKAGSRLLQGAQWKRIGKIFFYHRVSSRILLATYSIDAADSTVTIASTLADTRDAKLRDKIAFVRAIAKRQDIIFCDAVNSKTKEEAWREVAKEVEDLGLKSFAGKTWMRMRDHDWQYVRRHALARSENSHKPSGKLGELDQLVLGIVNKFNVRLSNDYHVEQMLFDMITEDSELVEVNSRAQHPEVKLEPLPSTSSEAPVASVVASPLSQLVALPPSSSIAAQPLKPEASPASCSNTTLKPKGAEACIILPTAGDSTESSLPHDGDHSKRPVLDGAVQLSISPVENVNSTPHVPAKRPRTGELSNVNDSGIDENAIFLRKRRELELRRLELENEKLEREIQSLVNQEKRAKELHNIELRRLRLQMVMMGADLLQEPQREE